MAWPRRRRKFYGESIDLPAEQKFAFTPEEAWASNHEDKPLLTQEVVIKCMDKMHRIRLTFPGPITLIHHPNPKADITMMKLGGEKPDCLKFLEAWKKSPGDVARSRPIVQKFLQARQDWKDHKHKNKSAMVDWLNYSFKDRLQARLTVIYDTVREKINKVYDEERRGKTESRNRWNYSYGYVSDMKDMVQGNQRIIGKFRLDFEDVGRAGATQEEVTEQEDE